MFLHTYLKGISIIFLTPYRETKLSTNANFGEKRTCHLARDEESWEELVPSNHVVHLDWIFLHSRRGAPSNNTNMIGGLIISTKPLPYLALVTFHQVTLQDAQRLLFFFTRPPSLEQRSSAIFWHLGVGTSLLCICKPTY